MGDDFELLGKISDVEIIAANLSIRERKRLVGLFGGKRWRKLKGLDAYVFPTA